MYMAAVPLFPPARIYTYYALYGGILSLFPIHSKSSRREGEGKKNNNILNEAMHTYIHTCMNTGE